MPNPYDDLLGGTSDPDPKPERSPQPDPQPVADPEPIYLNDPRFGQDGPEPLDEILALTATFDAHSGRFARLLSELGVMAHRADRPVTRLFLDKKDPHDRGSLAGERQLHELLETKFRHIIAPMLELARLHLETVRRFNSDIDKNYYSLTKTDAEVESDKTRAIDALNVQRQVLGDAAMNLEVLTGALKDTERRLKGYVNAGGRNNLSGAEFQMITRGREELTAGREHHFDYGFFDLNLLDKTAISLGVYLPETTAQYLQKLGKVLG